MESYQISAGRNLLRRSIDLAPGEQLVNRAEERLANLSGVEFSSRVVASNGVVHEVAVSFASSLGEVAYKRRPQSQSSRWSTWVYAHQSGENRGNLVEKTRKFWNWVLPALDDVLELVPWDHVPSVAVADLPEAHQALIRDYLPGANQTSAKVRDAFGDLLHVLARDLKCAWKTEGRARRIDALFEALPVGAVLIAGEWSVRIGIVSARKGKRTERSLLVRSQFGEQYYDLNRYMQDRFKLLTPERANEVPRTLMSAHEVMRAVARNKELVARFPDLV